METPLLNARKTRTHKGKKKPASEKWLEENHMFLQTCSINSMRTSQGAISADELRDLLVKNRLVDD